MKIILLTCLFFSLFTYGQNDKTDYYEYKFYRAQSEAKDTIDKNKNILNYIGSNRIDTIIYELKVNNEDAIFKARNKILNDQQEEGLNLREILINSYGSFYYNTEDSIVYNVVDRYGKKFSIKHNYNYINWEYLSKEEIINGYKCKLAKHTKKEKLRNGKERDYTITVWYSNEVKANAIPLGLTGLSGGIVKVNQNGFSEVLLDNYTQLDNEKITKIYKKGKVVTQKEYEEIKLEYEKKRNEMRRGGVDVD